MTDLLPISAEWLAAYRAVRPPAADRRCEECRWFGERCGHSSARTAWNAAFDCSTHRAVNTMYLIAIPGSVDCGPEARFWEPRS